MRLVVLRHHFEHKGIAESFLLKLNLSLGVLGKKEERHNQHPNRHISPSPDESLSEIQGRKKEQSEKEAEAAARSELDPRFFHVASGVLVSQVDICACHIGEIV